MITLNLVTQMNQILHDKGFNDVVKFNSNWKSDTTKIKDNLYSYFGQSPFDDCDLNDSIHFCNKFLIKMLEAEHEQGN